MPFFLRLGADALEDAVPFRTRAGALRGFQRVAEELAEYGQELEASVHVAPDRESVDEYPDYVLALGPRGGVRVERA